MGGDDNCVRRGWWGERIIVSFIFIFISVTFRTALWKCPHQCEGCVSWHW